MTEWGFSITGSAAFSCFLAVFPLLQYLTRDNFALEINFFKRRVEARGLRERDGILRVSGLFPLSPLWFLPFNLLLWGHRRYQENWVHRIILHPIPFPARSSPPPWGLPLRSISRGHANQELCEQFVWFLPPELPSPLEHFGGGGEGKRASEENQITSTRGRNYEEKRNFREKRQK